MTEADWLAATDPVPMLAHVRGKASDRKFRLFAVACCRILWPEAPIEATKVAIETNELFADGRAVEAELSRARSDAHSAAWNARYKTVSEPLTPDGKVRFQSTVEQTNLPVGFLNRLYFVAFMANPTPRLRADDMPMLRTDPVLSQVGPSLLSDIFGNPFRPVALAPSWRTEAVVGLAAGIYADRAFDRLPVLADALDDAGCAHPELLAHCRAPGPHVRGCWAVDLLLGKS